MIYLTFTVDFTPHYSASLIFGIFIPSDTMGASRPRHWFLAAFVLCLSSNLVANEVQQPQQSIDSSVIDARKGETNRTGVATIRRRRYVRFPTESGAHLFEGGGPPPLGRNLGPHPVARFAPQFSGSGWRQHKSLWRNPVIADYNRPVMSHRTPRLIFRDNDFLPPAGGGGASFFQQSNQLPDFEDDVRGKILSPLCICTIFFILFLKLTVRNFHNFRYLDDRQSFIKSYHICILFRSKCNIGNWN